MSVAIAVDQLTKNYGPTRALDGASFEVNKGDVHALLGENGAGKSTIVKVLSGLVRPNSGDVRINSRILPFGSPRASRSLGISTAFQEISQIPDLTVGRNLLLPEEPLRLGFFIDRAASRRRVAEIIEEQELQDIHPELDFRDLDLPLRQKIEIAKAIAHKPAILLLDEPTSALSGKDVDWLERRIEQSRASGATIIFITHRMPEVRRFCSRLSILRGGQHVGTFATGTVSDDDVMSLIVGRSIGSAYPRRASAHLPSPGAPPLLAVERLAVSPRLQEATFQIRPGEIFGLGGLQGMGQLELFHALFGIEFPTAGNIAVDGRPVVLASPRCGPGRGQPGAGGEENRGTRAQALREAQCFSSGARQVVPLWLDRFRSRARRGRAHPRTRAGPVARALHAMLRLQRRQPAENRTR